MTASPREAAVAAVEHDTLCATLAQWPKGPCDCTRDARIGAGVAAALHTHGVAIACAHEMPREANAAAVAAFIAASAKEER